MFNNIVWLVATILGHSQEEIAGSSLHCLMEDHLLYTDKFEQRVTLSYIHFHIIAYIDKDCCVMDGALNTAHLSVRRLSSQQMIRV